MKFRLILEVTRMKMRLLVISACVTVSLAGVRRTRRSIDPPVYGHGGRSARSYEFEETQAPEEYNDYVRAPRQAANTNYGSPGGGSQPAYQGGGRRHGHQIFLTNIFVVKVAVAEQEEAGEEVPRETGTLGPRQVTR